MTTLPIFPGDVNARRDRMVELVENRASLVGLSGPCLTVSASLFDRIGPSGPCRTVRTAALFNRRIRAASSLRTVVRMNVGNRSEHED
jgi:hypothetical protein